MFKFPVYVLYGNGNVYNFHSSVQSNRYLDFIRLCCCCCCSCCSCCCFLPLAATGAFDPASHPMWRRPKMETLIQGQLEPNFSCKDSGLGINQCLHQEAPGWRWGSDSYCVCLWLIIIQCLLEQFQGAQDGGVRAADDAAGGRGQLRRRRLLPAVSGRVAGCFSHRQPTRQHPPRRRPAARGRAGRERRRSPG